MQNMGTGFVITVVGMGLVFLTLIIVMLAIWLLDRIFRPSPEAEGSATTALGPPIVSELARDWASEAAAIAVAILTERRRSEPVSVTMAEAVPTHVVTVMRIDPGHGTWRGYGRLKAME